ncbi:MAG: MFS transporter [Thermomicrobiales bacterium]
MAIRTQPVESPGTRAASFGATPPADTHDAIPDATPADTESDLPPPHATPDARDGASGGILQSFRLYPVFRLLIAGSLLSSSAFWMYQVSVGWLALELTNSAMFVGLAGFAGGIPMLVLSIPAGVIIDRYDRRTVLLIAQSVVMVVSAVFAALVWFDLIHPWSMLLLVTLYGTVMSFNFPTRAAMVAAIVRRDDLANAVALNAATQNATRVIGPSLAGVLIALTGTAETFVLAAILQLLALLTTRAMPSMAASKTAVTNAAARGAKGWEALTVGLRIVAASPYLTGLIIISLAPTIFVMPYINLMPVFARDVLGLGSTGLGVLLAATGLGTVGGALSVARSSRMQTMPGIQLMMAIGFTIGVVGFVLSRSLWMAIPLLFVAGWASAAFLAINQTAVQLSVDDDIRGRVLSVSLLIWGMLPIGQLAVGTLAGRIGTPQALLFSCILSLLSIALIAQRYPWLRRSMTEEERVVVVSMVR